MTHIQTVKLGRTEYVILPKVDYLRLQGAPFPPGHPPARRPPPRAAIPEGSVDAINYGRASIGGTLRAAREHAGLTQAGLAKALSKSQSMVSGAESGSISVSDRYVHAVLKVCKLPAHWSGPRARRSKRGK
ncbi:MAG TPA: helix-turn-helix transcriptional regulator [Polyangiaceae bacterium]|jgi:ribosome-binding protein aMBF1 (putative translation factor)